MHWFCFLRIDFITLSSGKLQIRQCIKIFIFGVKIAFAKSSVTLKLKSSQLYLEPGVDGILSKSPAALTICIVLFVIFYSLHRQLNCCLRCLHISNALQSAFVLICCHGYCVTPLRWVSIITIENYCTMS